MWLIEKLGGEHGGSEQQPLDIVARQAQRRAGRICVSSKIDDSDDEIARTALGVLENPLHIARVRSSGRRASPAERRAAQHAGPPAGLRTHLDVGGGTQRARLLALKHAAAFFGRRARGER